MMSIMSANSSLNTSSTSMPAGWVQAGFPKTVQDVKQSLRFVRRLVAIGFSQILYLRTELADDCFKKHEIGDIDLRMLKAKSSSDAANKLTLGLKNAMEALELGYLRQLVIVIMEDKNKPEEAYETYTFNFNNPNNTGNNSGSPGFSLVQTARKINKPNKDQGGMKEGAASKCIAESENLIGNNPGNQSINGDADQRTIYSATKRLLRKLIFAIQGLNELPEEAFMTVQIGYFDEITPETYEPRGFRSSANASHFVDDVRPVRIGEVKSKFHQFTMSLSSKASLEPDINADQNSKVPLKQIENMPGKHNASFIPLNTGLDISAMDQSRQENGSILSHGSNVENCDTEISGEIEIANENILGNIQKGKGKGKKSKIDTEILPKTNRPTAFGDNQIEIRQLDAVNNHMKDDHSANTSVGSVRSQRSLRCIRKVSSGLDTFRDAIYYVEDFQPKASIAKKNIRI